jgi:GDSL-like Lipase/Acylhydrolase family
MADQLLPVAPDSDSFDVNQLPLLNNINLLPLVASSVLLNQQISATVPSNGIIPLNVSVQNAISSSSVLSANVADPILSTLKINDGDVINDNEINKFKYIGNWNLAKESNAYGGDAHWTNDSNASYEIKFDGSQIELFSVRNPWGGIAGIRVDNGSEKLVDIYGDSWQNQTFFKSDALKAGVHTIKVRVTGQKNIASGDNMISIDRAEVISSKTDNIDLPKVANPNDKSLLFSPYNWSSVGNSLQTSNAGAYLKFKFNGSQATLNVDTSDQKSFPLLDVYVDGQETSDQLWLKNITNGQVKLFAGGNGDHEVVVYFRRRELFDGTNPTVTATKQQDWLTDAEHLRVTGVQISGGTGFLNNPTIRSKNAIFFGDSITEGGTQKYEPNAPDRPANFPFTDIVNNFSYKTYAAKLGELLGVEYGQIGWSGSGWVRATTPTGNPPVLDSWLHYNGKSFVLRDFATQPDYVFINLGTNDTAFNPSENNINFNVTNTAYTWLKAARQKIPNAEIFVLYPFNQTKNEELQQAIDRYQKEAASDTKVHVINLGVEGAKGLVGPYIADYAIDKVHPTANRHQELANLLFDQIKPIVSKKV